MSRTFLLALLGLALLAVLGVAQAGGGVPAAQEYRGGATAVVDGDRQPVDRGHVICRRNGPSVGGACLPFGDYAFVAVLDDRFGADVAFQVCIDNNGDGVCGGPSRGDACADDQFFSHDDAGNFYNPLGPLPTAFRPGCGGGFPGYVVFICQGTHVFQGMPAHHHPATTGTVSPAPAGSGFGNFCQPESDRPAKTYEIR